MNSSNKRIILIVAVTIFLGMVITLFAQKKQLNEEISENINYKIEDIFVQEKPLIVEKKYYANGKVYTRKEEIDGPYFIKWSYSFPEKSIFREAERLHYNQLYTSTPEWYGTFEADDNLTDLDMDTHQTKKKLKIIGFSEKEEMEDFKETFKNKRSFYDTFKELKEKLKELEEAKRKYNKK